MPFLVFIFFLYLLFLGLFTFFGSLTPLEFQDKNFWDHHGLFFLVAITLFPRLTLLFSSVASGGFLWWLGFFFTPRLLVALLATFAYWNQNPLLVIISWMICLSGETGEKYVFKKRRGPIKFHYHYAGNSGAHGGRRKAKSSISGEVFEAEYEVKN